MGRPPIGKTAMTVAERVRRYRAKHGTGTPVTKPVTEQDVTKPVTKSSDAAVAKLRQQLSAANDEIKALREKLAGKKAAEANVIKSAGAGAKLHRLSELDRLKNQIAIQRGEIAELRAKLKVKEEMPKDAAELQRQLTMARSENRNLRISVRATSDALHRARIANPAIISKQDHATLRHIFHPDKENDTATPTRRKQLNDAFRIFEALKLNVVDKRS